MSFLLYKIRPIFLNIILWIFPLGNQKKFEKVFKNFLNHPQHQWIMNNDYLKRVFTLFFESLDSETYDFLYEGHELIFLQTNGQLSCTLSSFHNAHFIIIFPELLKLLTSCSPNHGLAILAH